jgi:cytochrome c oxidase subunit II
MSALDPAGIQAAQIADLWWLLLAVCSAVWILVMGVLLVATFRRHRGGDDLALPDGATASATDLVIGVATCATVITLFVLLALSFTTGRALSSLDADGAVVVQVVGHQFWWELRYNDPDPSREVTTANELHVPVGVPVVLNLSSQDVIHSFWVPSLHGKIDLIPGHENHTVLRADRPGTYRGQCAEFCGFQHAHMGIVVIAEPLERFQAWLDAQRAPGRDPSDDAGWTGRHILESRSCALCHAVRGAEANATVGPDLTHLASRATLAAGTVANTDDALAQWILDPQHVKPGANMPPTPLRPEELQALVHYLRSLS